MNQVVPPPFLFRYSIPVRYVEWLPKKGERLLDLPQDCAVPWIAGLDGAEPFAGVRVAWNAGGIGFSVEVAGKTRPPQSSAGAPADSDGLQVWIDTRNTQSIHRASRFCHHFCLLPGEGSRRARSAGFGLPLVVQLPIARAREDAPLAAPEQIRVHVESRGDGYRLEAWLAAEALHGFDPEANQRLGFYYLVRDAELGEQFLTVGRDFPFAHDPSVWSTLELVRG